MIKLSIFLFISMTLNTGFGNTPVHANRYLVYNILSDLFGPQSKDILIKNIINEHATFGGSCSLMENIKIDTKTNPSSIYYCRKGLAESKNHIYSQNLVRRNALVLTACKQLTENSDTLNYFLNQFNFYSSINDKAELIIKSFYPYHNNKAQLVLTSLRLLERTHVTKSQFDFGIKNYFQKQAPTERDKLKRLIYLTCISEKWQQL